MAITNADELAAEIAEWLDDDTLGPRIPTFIQLAEAEINRRLANAAVRPAHARGQTDFFVDSEYVTLPPDFAGILTAEIISIPGKIVRLKYVAPDNLVRMKAAGGEFVNGVETIGAVLDGVPIYYTVADDQMQFFPVPTAAYRLQIVYWATLPPLATNQTNWLLDKHPDVYLYATLAAAAGYQKDAEALATWGDWFDRAISGVLTNHPVPTDHTPLRNEVAGLLWQGRVLI